MLGVFNRRQQHEQGRCFCFGLVAGPGRSSPRALRLFRRSKELDSCRVCLIRLKLDTTSAGFLYSSLDQAEDLFRTRADISAESKFSSSQNTSFHSESQG